MRKIKLGGTKAAGKFLIVDDEDYDMMSNYSWSMDKDGYAQASIRGSWDKIKNTDKKVKAHRILMGSPIGMEIDHKNGVRLDCQKGNLRVATRAQNLRNQKKTRGSSKYKGVCLYKNSKKQPYWKVSITLHHKVINLGYSDSEEAAARMYDRKAKELFGEFAKLNFFES